MDLVHSRVVRKIEHAVLVATKLIERGVNFQYQAQAFDQIFTVLKDHKTWLDGAVKEVEGT